MVEFMKNKTVLQFKILLLILFIAAIGVTGCKTKNAIPKVDSNAAKPEVKTAEPVKTDEKTVMDAKLQKAEVSWVDKKGDPIWKAGFTEAQASQNEETAVVELKNVRAELYNQGKLVSKMIAPNVSADSKTYKVIATGGVKITSSAYNSYITAEKVVWLPKSNKIIGTGNIRMVKESITATAKEITADTSLNKVSLQNGEISIK